MRNSLKSRSIFIIISGVLVWSLLVISRRHFGIPHYHVFTDLPDVYTFKDGWKINTHVCNDYFHERKIDKSSTDFQLRKIKSPYGDIPIYTHDPKIDGISSTIAKISEHEPHTDVIIRTIMAPFPNAFFIDIGANIGVRSLQVLRSGRKVIAVEASDANIQHLCMSSALGRMKENLTIVYNALSDKHDEVKFAVGTKGDQSGNFVADDKALTDLKKKEDGVTCYTTMTKTVPSVTLDDILEIPMIKREKPVDYFIKLDVEGYEDVVLKRAVELFKSSNVIGVVLEWRWHKTRDSALTIIKLMQQYSMMPFTYDRKNLNTSNHQEWPHDVLWLPS